MTVKLNDTIEVYLHRKPKISKTIPDKEIDLSISAMGTILT